MVRALLSVVSGIALAWLVIAILLPIGHKIGAPPDGLSPANREVFKEAAAEMPLGAMFFFLASYSLGTLTGSWLAARISNRHFNAMLVGGVLMLAGMRDLIVAAPHPLWFTLLGIILFLPSAYLGGRLATPDT